MPAVQQAQQPGAGGQTYTETPEQKEAWKKLRAHIRDLGLDAGDTFTVKGTIAKILLDGTDQAPRYFTKKVINDKQEEKDWPFVKAICAITDPRFGKPGTLDFPAKNVGASYFDGRTSKGRSPNRGGMFNLHLAVTGAEPPDDLKQGKGAWSTEDYENRPILLRLEFQGKEDPESPYADRRLGMKIFVAGFEKDRDVHRSSILEEDDDDPVIVAERAVEKMREHAAGPTAAQEATKAANLADLPATERQVNFIYAIGRECELSKMDVREWSKDLYGKPVEEITRRDASSLIDALQRRRNETDGIDGPQALKEVTPADDKDELVGVGAAKGAKPVAVDDSDDFK